MVLKNEFYTLIQKYTDYLETLSDLQTINDTDLPLSSLERKRLHSEKTICRLY